MDLKNIRIGLFAYNFPHRKTYDFLLRLLAESVPVDLILAANAVKLDIPASSVKTKIRHQGYLHPQTVARNFGIPYLVCDHNSEEAVTAIKALELDLGIIAGARILKKNVIDAFRLGVLNIHPGLIPEVRGLDALLWTVHHDVPLGLTAHLIDHRVDAGTILIRRELPVYADDTLFDLSVRLHEGQPDLLREAIEKAVKGEVQHIAIDRPYNKKMEAGLERATVARIPDYIQKYSGK